MTSGLSVFEDRGVKHSNLKTGAPMSETPISPLRQRMLEDMSLRGFTPDTQGDYIRAVKKLAAFLGRSPDTATAEDLRAFQLHLPASGVQPPTINTTVTVLRFFSWLVRRPAAAGGPLTLSSPAKATLLWIILWRCSATAEHGIARQRAAAGASRDQQLP